MPSEVRTPGALLTLLMWIVFNGDTVLVSVFGSSEDVGLYGVGGRTRGGSCSWFSGWNEVVRHEGRHGRRTPHGPCSRVWDSLGGGSAAPWLVPPCWVRAFVQRSPVFRFSRWPGCSIAGLPACPHAHGSRRGLVGYRNPCRGVTRPRGGCGHRGRGSHAGLGLVFPAMSGWTVGAELLMLRRTRRVGVRGVEAQSPRCF